MKTWTFRNRLMTVATPFDPLYQPKDSTMKYLIAAATIVSGFTFATPALASEGGSCHFHGNKPTTDTVVVGCANQRRDALVGSGKLNKPWQAVKHDKVEMVDGKKGKEWRVTFRNPAEQDKSKATLYMFFTPAGNFIASNFTGQ